MKKLLSILIFILLINLHGQIDLSVQFNLAKNLYDKEEYFDAVTEFKRLLLFDAGKDFAFAANFYAGKSYKMGGRFSDAIRYFSFAEINAATGEELYSAKIENVKANILRKTTGRSLQILNELEADKRFSSKKDDILYWKGWAYIFADDWEKAAESFNGISDTHELKALSEKTAKLRYSVPLAKGLSFIIPGAGQIYTGEYISGLLSFGWNLLSGYLTVDAFIDDRIFDGLVTANFLWMRFYLGSIQNAEKFAVEKNIAASNEALNYLQNEYTGLKPAD